ncbi:beta-ketoacyl synthase [Aspergillus spectabilis]
MTLDTACSSGLVALHHTVQSLRSGESRIAAAAGANLTLGPEMIIAEANLYMLPLTGRSRMWDAAADGYARGEGLAGLFKVAEAVRRGQIPPNMHYNTMNPDVVPYSQHSQLPTKILPCSGKSRVRRASVHA